MYAHIRTVIDTYEPPEKLADAATFYIEIDGIKYYLDSVLWDRLLNPADMTLPTIDVIEVMHLQKRFKDRVKEYETKYLNEEDELGS